MKTKRKYFYLDDFEHRLLVGCLMTARNEFIHEDKPIEDVNELILKIIDAPSKKTACDHKGGSIMDMSTRKEIISGFYGQYDEDGRTCRSRHGQLEYNTSMA